MTLVSFAAQVNKENTTITGTLHHGRVLITTKEEDILITYRDASLSNLNRYIKYPGKQYCIARKNETDHVT
jgi:hypothetical protein